MSTPPMRAEADTGMTLPTHYEVRHCLGEGGFGVVFEAWDSRLRRSVAIKRLKNLGDANHSARLIQEAQLAASLQHAAFVKVFALEETGNTTAIIMELVRGKPLKQLLTQSPSPLSEQQALAIILQIAEAMRDAHASGLVHGDLKPSNIMLQPADTIRILDFGLATQADTQATTSMMPAEPQGTIAYMAPERLQGQPLRATSDIYALGVMLYELATGARPFASLSGLALAAAHLQSTSSHWPYPATMRPALIQLIRLMTATPVAQRLQSMQQVCEQIHQMDDVSAQTPTIRRRMRVPSRALGLGGALIVVVAGMYFSLPYLPSAASLQSSLQPYSEAGEMQAGLQALNTWDRPGGLDSASQHFSAVLTHSANSAAAAAGMALVYCLRYSSDHQDEIWLRKARAAAQQALAFNPQLALAQAAMGYVLAQEGKNASAMDSFERALALDPENIHALSGKISTLLKMRHFDQALRDAQAATQKHPRERLFLDQAGSVHYAQGNYQLAEQAFRLSLRIEPDAVVAYANLSAALASQNREEAALHVLQQGLLVRPSATLYGNLGNMLFLRADYQGAVAAFEAAVAPANGNPADYLGWANLADTLLWLPGREADARRAYARARELLAPRLARTPDDVLLVSRMALYAARTGDHQQCRALLQRALALAPTAADVQFRAGLAYELIGERAAALRAIMQAITFGYPLRFIEAAPELMALRRDPAYTSLAH